MNSNDPSPALTSEEINIGQIVQTLWQGKWILIFFTFIAGAIGVAYAIMATPIYNGKALLQIETKSAGGFAGLTGLADAFGGGGSSTSTELELLKARKVMVPTVENFKLEIVAAPTKFPYIGAYFYRIYGQKKGFGTPLFEEYSDFTQKYAWGGEKIEVNQFKVPDGYINTSFTIIKLKDDKYSLQLNGKELHVGTVGVSYQLDNSNIQIQIAKLEAREGTYFSIRRLNQILVVENLQKKLAVSENGKGSGVVRISMTGSNKKSISDIIDYVLSTYQQQNVEYNSIEAGKSLDFVEAQLPETTSKMRDAEQKIYEYRLNNKTVDLTLQTQQLLNQLLKIEESLSNLNLREPEISRKFKRQHPIYIEFLRKKQDLEKKRDEINAETGEIPTEQFNIFRLQRDVQLSQKIYLQMLNRYEELKIIKAGTIGSIRVVDSTVVSPIAVKPQKAIIAVASTLVGIFLALGIIALRAILSKGIETIKQLEEVGLNVLGSIPQSKLQKKLTRAKSTTGSVRILSYTNPVELAVEAVRSLRTSLHFSMMDAKNNILMVSSASPEVGKSFIAQNLAVLMAQAGTKTLLIDADLRKGTQHNNFGVKSSPGLSEYLAQKCDLEEMVVNSKIDNLDIISNGKAHGSPSDLLSRKSFAEACQKFSKKYDVVIIDTPPILAVTDAAIIGKHSGSTIMVVKQNSSKLKEVEFASKTLELSGVDIRGYVLNSVNMKNKQSGFYHYEYK